MQIIALVYRKVRAFIHSWCEVSQNCSQSRKQMTEQYVIILALIVLVLIEVLGDWP